MKNSTKIRPTAPLVINLIALFIVLGGQALALGGNGRVKRDDLAPGAVTARAIAPGVVTSAKLAAHAVTGAGLADQAVTGRTVTHGSVHGLTLAGTFQTVANVPDADAVADFTWTTSGGAVACPASAILLNGGLKIQDSGLHRAFIQAINPSSSNLSTWVGQISTDTAGASSGELRALCLR